jgi:hypothetical protein
MLTAIALEGWGGCVLCSGEARAFFLGGGVHKNLFYGCIYVTKSIDFEFSRGAFAPPKNNLASPLVLGVKLEQSLWLSNSNIP